MAPVIRFDYNEDDWSSEFVHSQYFLKLKHASRIRKKTIGSFAVQKSNAKATLRISP